MAEKRFITKNGLQTQNINFVSPNNTYSILAEMLDSDTIAFSGSSGQLFSITDSLTGTIFSVNDISGIPSIEVLDDGTIRLAQYAGNVGVGKATPTAKLDIADTTLAGSGSLAGSVLNLTQTWNTSGTPTAIKLNVTNTASGGVGRLLDLQVGGTSVFAMGRDGVLRNAGIAAAYADGVCITAQAASRCFAVGYLNGNNVQLGSTTSFGWTAGADSYAALETILVRDAAHTIAQRNGVNAQVFRLYNTYTDASNYERAKFAWSSNVLQIGTEEAGAGTARALALQTDGTTRLNISATTPVIKIGNDANGGAIFSFSGSTYSTPANGTSLAFFSYDNGLNSFGIAFGADSVGPASGSGSHVLFARTFAPTSGTSLYHFIDIQSTVNQTGGANGITRGIYVRPTLTAAADWRSIETSNATGWAIYTAGAANSYFGGNVGIGTTNPTSRLAVRGGGITVGTTDTQVVQLGADGSNVGYVGTTTNHPFIIRTNGSNNRIWVSEAGDVGINNAAPSQKLHVTGSVRVTGAYYDSNNDPGTSGQVLSSTATGTNWISLSEITGVDGTGTANYLAKWSDADTITNSQLFDNGTNIGIGTTSPANKIHIRANSGGFLRLGVNDANADTVEGRIDWFSNEAVTSDYFGGLRMRFQGGSGANNRQMQFLVGDSATPRVVITGQGYVGVGTNAPDRLFVVTGSNTTGLEGALFYNSNTTSGADVVVRLGVFNGTAGLTFRQSTNSTGPAAWASGSYDSFIQASQGGSKLHFAAGGNTSPQVTLSGGNVGIGITNPSSKLVIAGNLSVGYANENITREIVIHSSSPFNEAGIIRQDGSSLNFLYSVANQSLNFGSSSLRWALGISYYGGSHSFYGTSGANPIMLIDNATSNVGIGISTPKAKLHSGNALVAQSFLGGSYYHYSSGILIRTDIAVSDNRMFELTIEGNSYNDSKGPVFARVQAYNYITSGTIINTSAFSTDPSFTIDVFHYDGFVYFWFAQTGSFQTYTFKLISPMADHVISQVSNAAKPVSGVTNSVTITPAKLWNSLNDGAGSGLDADTLDGQQLSSIVSGTTNYVSKFTSANAIGNSQIFDNATNVGINTSSPLTKLDVRSGSITAGTQTSVSGSEILRGYYSNGALTVIGTEHSSGGPVIGYAVRPSTTTSASFLSTTDVNVQRSAYSLRGGNHSWFVGAGGVIAIDSAVSMTEAMVLTNAGSVGIGITSPAQRLEVGGANTVGIRLSSLTSPTTYQSEIINYYNSSKAFEIFNAGISILRSSEAAYQSIQVGSTAYYENSSASGYHRFMNGATEFMRINSTGVGVGTASPYARLSVGAEIVDDNSYVYDTNSVAIVHQTATSTTTLNDPKDVLLLGRQGTNGQAYGAAAVFRLSRYENAGSGNTGSRTRLDLVLAHNMFLTSPTAVMTFASSGNVGIGTFPSAKLQLDSTVDGADGIFCKNSSTGTSSFSYVLASNNNSNSTEIRAYGSNHSVWPNTGMVASASGLSNGLVIFQSGNAPIRFWTNTLERVRIDGSGNVGIGTNAPYARLQVGEAAATSLLIDENRSADVTEYASIFVTSSSFPSPWNTSGNLIIKSRTNTGGGRAIIFAAGGSANTVGQERLVITGDGKVGIGTYAPTTLLEVSGENASNIIRSTTTSNLGTTAWAGVTAHEIQFYNADPSGAGIYSAIRVIGSADSGNPGGTAEYDFTVWTGGYSNTLSEKFRITNRGLASFKLTDNTTSYADPASVNGLTIQNDSSTLNTMVGLHLRSAGVGASCGIYSQFTGTDNTDMFFYTEFSSRSVKMTLKDSGRLGIGTTAPDQLLHVAGDINVSSGSGFRINNTATSGEYLRGNGTRFVSSAIQAADVPTLNQNTTGSAGTLLYTDNRIISPNELASNRMSFGFTSYNNNNSSPYADFIHLRSYQDASGGLDNLLVFNKSTGIGMRLYQQTYNSASAYSTYKDVVLAANTPTVNYLTKYSVAGEAVTVANSQIFDNGTNVGIGTTSPAQKLQVNGNIQIDQHVYTTQNYTGFLTPAGAAQPVKVGSLAITSDYGNSAATNGLYVQGSVGIGTTSPTVKLDVNGGEVSVTSTSANPTLTLTDTTANNDPYIRFVPATSANAFALGIDDSDSDKFKISYGSSAVLGVSDRLTIDTSGNIGIGTASPTYKLHVIGSFAATTKSFVIDHPTKPNQILRHGSLEGPEFGVYVRGRSTSNTIQLPDYWTGLVDESTITVNITPIGKYQNKIRQYTVKCVENNKIIIETDSPDDAYNYYYIVFAERKDIGKLTVEECK